MAIVTSPVLGSGCDDKPIQSTPSADRIAPDRVRGDRSSIREISVPERFINRYWTFTWVGEGARKRGVCVSSVGDTGSINCFDRKTIAKGWAFVATEIGTSGLYEVIFLHPDHWRNVNLHSPARTLQSVQNHGATAGLIEGLPTLVTAVKRGLPVSSSIEFNRPSSD